MCRHRFRAGARPPGQPEYAGIAIPSWQPRSSSIPPRIIDPRRWPAICVHHHHASTTRRRPRPARRRSPKRLGTARHVLSLLDYASRAQIGTWLATSRNQLGQIHSSGSSRWRLSRPAISRPNRPTNWATRPAASCTMSPRLLPPRERASQPTRQDSGGMGEAGFAPRGGLPRDGDGAPGSLTIPAAADPPDAAARPARSSGRSNQGSVKHLATPRFWRCYAALPQDIRHLADRCYALLKGVVAN